MQNQVNRTDVQAITSAQSLASVQTLLKAGLGCIAFMRYDPSAPTPGYISWSFFRDLLPNDNFSESKLYRFKESYSLLMDGQAIL